MTLSPQKSENNNLRPYCEMEILENPMDWLKEFQNGWLAHYEKTGTFDWKKYIRPRNSLAPHGKAVDLAKSKLLFISSSGAFLPRSQEPFDASNPLGDYSIRSIPTEISFDDLAYSHEHYDHRFVKEDPQTILPLKHLRSMVEEGKIGSLASEFISFSGYHPNIIRLIKETIPAILKVAKELEIQAALLVPV